MKYKIGQRVKFLGYKNRNGALCDNNSKSNNTEGFISRVFSTRKSDFPYGVTFCAGFTLNNIRENEIESLNINPNCKGIRV